VIFVISLRKLDEIDVNPAFGIAFQSKNVYNKMVKFIFAEKYLFNSEGKFL